ncbi:MAG: lysine--tRNA ligase [Candidatus Aenigmatarchaeota archaeon]
MAEKSLFWADQYARKLVEREEKLDRGIKVFLTEAGVGASGVPHIGSLGDVLRQYAVTLALRDLGYKSDVIAFSDDRDGLRKVPLGFPNSLEKDIGRPVTDIKDPFGCHDSFGSHVKSLLTDAIGRTGIDYIFRSAREVYGSGMLNSQIGTILNNADKIKRMVKKTFDQDLPSVYFPVCEACGKIYTTRVVEHLPKEHKVKYRCDLEFTGKNLNTGRQIVIKGCGHEGVASYWNATGKLAWKAEFAARWAAQGIVFEAVGKDILDSVKMNDRVCKEVLGFEPPLHMVYEMFLEKGGAKISKSIGNVFSPQDWFRYGSPESLSLLMFKRVTGTRELAASDITSYMAEVDRLADVYFGKEKVANEKELAHLKRLYEHIYFLKPPKAQPLAVPYSVLVSLVKVLPIKDKGKMLRFILAKSGHIPERLGAGDEKELARRIEYAESWAKAMGEEIKPARVAASAGEKKALGELAAALSKEMAGEDIQNLIFETAKKHGVKPPRFFKLIYQLVLGIDRGPRAGELIKVLGQKKVAKLLKSV